jgi:eukaryotic-like serine/threonine-protein kinase
VAELRSSLAEALHDRYVLEQELGRGGMATVYLAQDLKHDRPVALKVMRPDLSATLGAERFLREIRITARLEHPHILPVFDSGEATGLLWYTMPYVEGHSLRDRLRHELQLPVDEALRLTREVADALESAHRHNVLHRDIKPANILLSDGHARVADFGLAAAVEAAGSDRLTGTGVAVGTPAYMSPEQGSGGRLDGRSDIYALGCVLYEMLVGEPPYTGPTSQIIAMKHLTSPVPSVRVVREAVPRAVEEAIARALAKVPADRFPTAGEFGRALEQPSGTAVGQTSSPPTNPAIRPNRRRLLAVLLLAVLLAGTLILRHDRSATVGAPNGGPRRLAVLPFENQGDSAHAYFVEGIADQVRGKLAALPGLRVIARLSSDHYRASDDSPKRIGRALGVEYLLMATVQWDTAEGRSQVRVTADLINAADATTVWHQLFDAPLTGLFEVQGSIADRVAQSLGVVFGVGEERRLTEPPTRDLAAYDLYLRGRALWNQRTPSAIEQSLTYFTAAVGRDSTYAEAYAGLAETYALFPPYEVAPPADAYPRARQAAQHALALDSMLGQAYAVLAGIYDGFDWDPERAEKAYRRAMALSPSSATTHQWYAEFLSARGRHAEAMAEMEQARSLDPLSLIISASIGDLLYRSRHFENAIAEVRRTIGTDSTFAYAHDLLGAASLLAGHRAQAVVAFETAVRLTGRREYLGDLVYAYAAAGRRKDADAAMRELTALAQREYVSPYTLAIAHTGLGHKDEALAWLERAAQARSFEIADALAVEPFLDPLRGYQRFQRLLARVGLPAIHGSP